MAYSNELSSSHQADAADVESKGGPEVSGNKPSSIRIAPSGTNSSEAEIALNTGGGAVVGDNVTVDHGSEFAGRDKYSAEVINVYSASNLSSADELARHHQLALSTIGLFRRAVVEMQIDQAQAALRKLSEPEMAVVAAPEIDLAHRIYRLMMADATEDIARLVQHTTEWPDECVAAYLMCYRRLYETIPSVLRAAKDFLPLPTNSRLRVELERAARTWPNIQPLRWPVVKLRVPHDNSPFRHERAEDDRATLFGRQQRNRRPVFWPEHPLFHELHQTDYPQVVTGLTGSGRTTMGLALGKYGLAGQARLSLYLPGQFSLDAIVAGYARLFLDFAQTHPTRLSRLNTEERVLLARLFGEGLGKDYVLAEIRAAQLALAAGSEWESLKDAQFSLLAQQVEKTSPGTIGEFEWPRWVALCARMLGFDPAPVLLVVDTHQPDAAALQHLLAQVERWSSDGVVTLIFVSHPIANLFEQANLAVRELTWNDQDFRLMLNHRYRNVTGQRHHIENEFDSRDTFNVLLECSANNPRRFVQLWKICSHARKAAEPFDADLVRLACARLGQVGISTV
jgi:hypothetical protein